MFHLVEQPIECPSPTITVKHDLDQLVQRIRQFETIQRPGGGRGYHEFGSGFQTVGFPCGWLRKRNLTQTLKNNNPNYFYQV